MVGEGRGGTEGHAASAFPVHSGVGRLLGPNPLPSEPPSCVQSPSPAPAPHPGPYVYPRRRPPPRGPKPHTHPPPRASPPNSGTPRSRGPPFHMLPLPFWAGPKQQSCPTLKHHPTSAPPPVPYPAMWVLSLGPCPTLKSHPPPA